jgi:hypothetical protein
MTCSDCHGTDSTVSHGPHGSAVKWMLNPTTTATAYTNWPYTTAAGTGTSTGTTVNGTGNSTVPGANFCFSCHLWAGGGQAHTGNTNHNVACVECHIRVPHGGKVPRLLRTGTATVSNVPARYRPNGNGGNYVNTITGWNRPATGTMSGTNCNGCGAHSGTATFAW